MSEVLMLLMELGKKTWPRSSVRRRSAKYVVCIHADLQVLVLAVLVFQKNPLMVDLSFK